MDSEKVIKKFDELFAEAISNDEFHAYSMKRMDETGNETVSFMLINYLEKNNELWKEALRSANN